MEPRPQSSDTSIDAYLNDVVVIEELREGGTLLVRTSPNGAPESVTILNGGGGGGGWPGVDPVVAMRVIRNEKLVLVSVDKEKREGRYMLKKFAPTTETKTNGQEAMETKPEQKKMLVPPLGSVMKLSALAEYTSIKYKDLSNWCSSGNHLTHYFVKDPDAIRADKSKVIVIDEVFIEHLVKRDIAYEIVGGLAIIHPGERVFLHQAQPEPDTLASEGEASGHETTTEQVADFIDEEEKERMKQAKQEARKMRKKRKARKKAKRMKDKKRKPFEGAPPEVDDVIALSTYHIEIAIFYSAKPLAKWMRWAGASKKYARGISREGRAKVLCRVDKKDGHVYHVIRIPRREEGVAAFDVISYAHEATHLANNILAIAGVFVSPREDEAQAYLIGAITGKLFTHLSSNYDTDDSAYL